MKKSPVSTSILSLCLIATIAATAWVVATRSSLAAYSYSAFNAWMVAPRKMEAPFVGEVTLTATAGTATGSFTTLKGAFDAINAGTHQGVIAISINADTTETASAVLNASGSGAASYTSISIQPVGGAARTISGAIAAGSPMIDFNGADNVTIDGLNTGGNSLTIANTTAAATSGTSTIRFIGGATNNTITNCNLQGSSSSSVATNGGTIFFSTDAVTANGNDNNTISNNNIGPAGANLPSKAILGNGSTTTTAIGNSGIVINNNNIFDYFGAAVTSSGVATNGGCNAWSITNNRFYQTGTRTWTTGLQHTGINIGNTTATSGAQGFTITGNTIGFASNTQTGVYTLTGAGTGAKFIGILFNGIVTGTTTNVNNNTVAAVSMTGVTGSGTTTSSPFIGILFQEGNGITNNNTVGSQSATGSLTFSTTTTSATDVYGIFNFTSNAWTSNNNNIGGISVTNLGASGTFLLMGMRAFTGTTVTWTANSNTVGGTVANSMQLNATGTASQVLGMFTSNAPALLTSNTVRNLTSNIGTGTATAASVIGIGITSGTPNSTLSQNTVAKLTNTNATAATVVTGIQFNGATANVVERNLIHSLTSATNSTAAEINGIRVAGGTTVYRNNMIAIGEGITNAIGVAATNTGTVGINGINEALGTNSFFHNSVYIGGSPTAGTGASYAFNGTQTTVTRSVRDNIFFNARSNAGATGKNYVIKINGTTPNPAGLTINNNLYFANGTGAVFGFFNSLDVADLATWRTAVGQDTGSFALNPQYADPTNATPDLHLHPTNPTPAEGNGVDVGVTNDFDGQTRASLTPVDIGADAGNFNGVDLAPPVITYTALGNTSSTTNRTLSVTLTDVTGVATGGSAPRVYFNKNAGTYSSTACTLASGTVMNGVWNCTIDNALLGGVATNDVIRYFVVAQDTLGNLGANPVAGFVGINVNTVTTPPTTPNSYLIAAALAGTKTVCAAGCDYTTLTGATGIFKAINDGVATGNIEIQIAGDLTVGEDGTNGLNALSEEPSGSNFTVKLYPTGAARAITGSFNGALIRMNGSSRVTIDGSIGGTGTDRSLTITNTSITSPSVVLFGSIGTTPITNDTLKNCIVINGVNTSSAVVISDAGTLGNAGFFSNITIQNNDVQKAFVGVFATGGTTPQGGSNLVYTQNKLNTSGANAIRDVGLYMQGVNGATVSQNMVGNIDKTNDENDTGIWLATGTINTTVSGNTVSGIGYTGVGAFGAIGINVSSSVANTNNDITGNNVSDISSNGGSTGSLARGIVVSGTTSDLTIQKNNVQGIINTNNGTFPAYGLDISGGNNIVVKNNFVSNISQNMTGGAAFSTTFGVFGIRVGAGTGHLIYHNSVNLYGALSGTATSSLLSAAFALVSATSTGCDVRDNIFANTLTGGTTSIAHVSVFLPSGGTSAMNLTWNNNSYYFGTDAARQGVGQAGTTAGTNFFTALPSLAAYTSTLSPAATNDNASLASTGAVPFVSANDLHLGIGAPEVNAGAAIASVTDDIDGDMRPSMPDIGADEVATTVSSINLAAASPVCGGTTVSWTVTFAASVTGLTTSNFALANTGLTGPMITGISGGGTTWTVTADTGTGSGLLGLNLANSTGVTPAISPLPFTGQVYTINAPPTTANAGQDQTLCTTSPATLAANTPSVGTGDWTVVTGPSTLATQFSSTTSPTAMFTPAGGAGTYTLRWTISNAPCTASTDDVVLTFAATPTAANAGPDQTLCTTSPATLGANTPSAGTGAWTVVTGPSTSTTQFSSTISPTATFTPAGGAGVYTLRWTISNAPCTASTDDVVITYNAPPTTANAGQDQTLCTTSPATLAANTLATGTGAWSVVSGPSTSNTQFSNPASPTATFTPAAGAGTYTLRWTISNAPCTASTDDVVLTFTAPPTAANAGIDQNLCNVTSATMAGNIASSGTGAWSQTGGPNTATITTASSPTTTMTGLIAGTYTFRWTISSGACTASMDEVQVTIAPLPTTANAGIDQNLCNVTSATMAGNIASSGTGAWSQTGGPNTATIASPSSPTTMMTGLIAGTYTFRWTISSGACIASMDEVQVVISALPTTANAGSDQTLCGTTQATLAANAPGVGTGAWSVVSGPLLSASQFSNTGANNATFTPAGGSGSYTLRWTTTNGSCTSADDVVLTYNTASTITTNPMNQLVLPGNTATFTAAASGTPTPTVQWQVSTDGVNFTNIPSATSTTLSFTAAGADNGKKYRAVFTNSCSPPATTTAAMLTTGTTPPLTVQAGGQPNNAGANLGDPAICLDPGGLVGVEATLTNAGNATATSSFTANLLSGLTAVAGSCIATSVNPGTCTIAANGGSVMWNGTLNAGETVSIIYRARISANAGLGSQLCIDNAGAVNGIPAQPLKYCFTLSCPLTNTRVSDGKAGAVLVFPYYTSVVGGASDTRISITNTSSEASTAANQTAVHVFFIDGTSCQQLDFFVCLTPNATFAFKASEYDPDSTGYIIAVAVDNQGRPAGTNAARNPNVLLGNAFVNTPQFQDNYGAESFRANSNGVATVEGDTATLYFDQTGYDAVPKQFAIEIQSPLDTAGQQIITASMSGNLTTGQMSGAAQVGTGLAFNEKEVFGSFSNWLLGTCQARGTISTNSPRVPNGLGNLIKSGQAGSLRVNVGAAVGLLMTPRTAMWKGIRTLHKTQTTAATLTIPIFVPVC